MAQNPLVRRHSKPMVEFVREKFDHSKEPKLASLRPVPQLLERFCYSMQCRTTRTWIRHVIVKTAFVYACSGCLRTRQFDEATWTDEERGVSPAQAIMNEASAQLEKLRAESREKVRRWRAEHPAGYKSKRAVGHKHAGVCGKRCFK